MKIYIVSWDTDYNNRLNDAVFTSRTKAEAYAGMFSHESCADVEEFDVLTQVPDRRLGARNKLTFA